MNANGFKATNNQFRGVAEMVSPFTRRAFRFFVITQTEEKLRRENIKGKTKANQTHNEVGAKVRKTIKEIGGTMPEDLPTPDKSIKQIEREKKRIKGKK